jgi:hypothetical protein
MRRFIPFGLLAAAFMTLTPPLQAQDVTGEWTLTYTMMGRQGGPGREVSMDITLAQDGTTVTGTALMAMGRPGAPGGEPQEVEITEGSIEGDQLTFTITRGMGERTFSTVYTATVSGNEMEGNLAMAGGRGNMEPIPFKGVKKEG